MVFLTRLLLLKSGVSRYQHLKVRVAGIGPYAPPSIMGACILDHSVPLKYLLDGREIAKYKLITFLTLRMLSLKVTQMAVATLEQRRKQKLPAEPWG